MLPRSTVLAERSDPQASRFFDEDPSRIFAGGPFSDRHGGPDDDMATFVPLAPRERGSGGRASPSSGTSPAPASKGFGLVDPELEPRVLRYVEDQTEPTVVGDGDNVPVGPGGGTTQWDAKTPRLQAS